MTEGFTWDASPEDVFPSMADEYVRRIQTGIRQLAERYAPEIEAWLKTNAGWTDRTGNARQTLWSDTEHLGYVTIINVSHGVDYGIFLELAHGGRFAIIGPAIDYFAPRIWADVQRMMGR